MNYDPITGWREGNNRNPYDNYEGRSIMALFGKVRVIEYARRRYKVVEDEGRTKDCGADLRKACEIARKWAGVDS